ncbi:hypothetical protein V1506DRAFT_533023 [Lipomyces tetrasporus]
MDSAVKQIVDMGFSHSDAAFALQASNNDVGRAIDYIFSGQLEEDRRKNQWNESEFMQANWEPADNNSKPTVFNENEIQAFAPETFYGDDDRPKDTYTDRPAPGNIVELGGADDEQMDDDIATAMRMSLQDLSASDAGMGQHTQQVSREGQESGVVFGPATQDSYNEDQWGMMTLSGDQSAAQNSFELESSQRGPGEQPILRPCERAKNLAPLLMILHSIPRSRAALLLFGKQLAKDYGIASTWWDKELIFVPEFAESSQKQEDLQRLLLLLECQRIMAFLHIASPSGRAYASIENLVHALSACQETYMDLAHSDFITDSEPIANFSKVWSLVAGQYADSLAVPSLKAMSDKLFNSWVSLDRPAAAEADSSAMPMEQKFVNLELVITEDVRTMYGSLVGALDSLLWSEEPDAYLKSVADIFVISIKRENWLTGAGVDLPLEWYPDRYTMPFMKVMRPCNKRRAEILDEIQNLRKRRFQIAEYTGYNTKSLLDSTIAYFTAATAAETDTTPPILTKLQQLTANLDQYIARLDKKIGFLEQEIRSLTEFLSEPPAADDIGARNALASAFGDRQVPDFHRYTLAGVIVSDSIAYFKRKVEPLDGDGDESNILEKQEGAGGVAATRVIDSDTDTGGLPALDEQYEWLRYTFAYYSGNMSDSFEVRPVNPEQVIDVARSTGPDGVVAVYASDDAYRDSAQFDGLVNAGLKEFLARDHELLRRELSRTEQPIDLINLEPATNERELISTPTTATSSSFEVDSDRDEARNEKSVISEFIQQHIDNRRAAAADRGGQADEEWPEEPDRDPATVDDDAELMPASFPASPELARRISISGAPTSDPAAQSPTSSDATVMRGRGSIVHSGSGKGRVEHAEHADDRDMADSDEEMLDRMRRR